ncbi:MAG: hypothetical protein LUH11_02070, partial [Candidatus Gastranaerophilales bacterium]|nr:hypothetical protein [Candidatus Gastranaerophilales bacterium]
MSDNYSKLVDTAYNLHISGNFNGAKDIYEKLLNIKPDDINVLNLYAQLNFSIKNYDLALDIFKKIYEKCKLDEVQLNIAKVFMAKNDYKSAIAAIHMLKEENVNSLRLQAAAYTKLSRNDDAINTYIKIINNNRPSVTDLLNLSILYYRQENLAGSLKYALEAYSINNNDIDLNLHLASIYEKQSDWQNALDRLLFVSTLKTDIY